MIFVVLCIAAIGIYAYAGRRFRKNALKNIIYKVRTNTHEVFEGEDFFLYESIANAKEMALPNIRVDISLPKGLDFCLYEKNPDGSIGTSPMRQVESVFVLKPGAAVERRWRLSARRRGIYHLGEARMVLCDIFGTNKLSAFYEADKLPESTVTVLPSPIDLERHFAPAFDPMGDRVASFSLTPDPLLIAGAREYREGDPRNKINWKVSARMHRPMVNIDENTEKNSFDIVFNLQSRGREEAGQTPESEELVELGVSVCAAVFDTACAEEIPVRLICNTVNENSDKDYFISEHFKGHSDAIEALRMLAGIEMRLSCRIEKMLEELLCENELSPQCENLILVTSYIDETIVNFALAMQRLGIEVAIYATSGLRTMSEIPEELTVYYKTYR